ncbi:hypothetical protein KRX51_08050 [Corynebacterium sp. TAE3-ERU12]|uniref:sterol carrier family protein n=1 Tax=Corynebacterium sp. TAE3-ERU12 TaxID=2849491 RepID=UPI001C43785A|nr:sterol carrier family protein [Corynebacterium sp. TAE3-ERU12]MBV7295859.1 hypothetical protein [Corynebacterium sp. TAE3-ERU12]
MANIIQGSELADAIRAVEPYIDGTGDASRAEIARAVRLSARMIGQLAPGKSVELRVPPFVAVQCIEGTTHTRGTPPAVVETDPRTWLRIAVGRAPLSDADVSGQRADAVERYLPVIRLPKR